MKERREKPLREELLEVAITGLVGLTVSINIVGNINLEDPEFAPLVRDGFFIASTATYLGLMSRELINSNLRRPVRTLLYTTGYAGLLTGAVIPLL